MKYYLGFEFAPSNNWQAVLKVRAPSNYKDAKKIAEYIDTRTAELAGGKAAVDPLCGRVSKIGCLTVEGTADAKFAVITPAELAKLLQHSIQTGPGDSYIGWRIHRAFQLLAIDQLRQENNATLALLNLDPRLPYGKLPGYLDPVAVLFGSSDVDIDSVMTTLNQQMPQDAEGLARLACWLAPV